MNSGGWSLEIYHSREKHLLLKTNVDCVFDRVKSYFFFILEKHSTKRFRNNLQMFKKKKTRKNDIQVLSLVVWVRASRGTWHGGKSMDGGGTGGHPRTQLACLEAPKQFFVSATQTFFLIALFLHIHLQVGVLLRELPDKENRRHKTINHTEFTREFGKSENKSPPEVGISILISVRLETQLTWTQQYSCLFSSWGPHSAAVTLGLSPPGRRSFQPAQKHSTNGAQHYFSRQTITYKRDVGSIKLKLK